MANDAFFKPSLHVDKFVPEDYSLDTERFLVFLRAYYEWLQTTKITITGLSGTFVRDETVTGTGGGVAVVKEVGTGYIIVKMTSRLPFNRRETITGGTSNATATVSVIKDNVIRASGNLQNYKNIELSIDEYVSYLREELYPSIPTEYYGDKRLLATKFKKYFESKSNEESYRFIFRLLYNEDVEFYYPGEDVLRVSDGNYEEARILRAEASSDSFEFVNKTIVGQTSGALANVVDVKVLFIGSVQVAEMTLSLVSGTFQGGETIADLNDSTLTATLYGMITEFTINDGGSGYRVNDVITITGDGSAAQAVVGSVKETPISAIKVNEIGHGYRLNANAVINNTGTGGTGLAVRVTGISNTYSYTDANTSTTYTLGEISKVQILNRGSGYISAPTITLQDTAIASLGLLSAELITIVDGGSDYGVGNTLIFTGGSGANAAGQVASVEESVTYDLLFEDGMRMISEDSYYDIIKNEDWDVIGPIARVELTNFGDGYETANLPSITISTTTGSGANVIATNIQGKSANVSVDVANNVAGIGAIRQIEIRDFGVDYTTATADATAVGDGNANLTPVISGIGTKEGFWVDDDGKVNYKFIQDSLFYQDFSYVLKSGLAFSTYATTLKQIIHPAGLQFFGEILISSFLDVSPRILSSSVVSEIQQYIIYIESFFSMGIEDSSSVILREIRIEGEPIHANTDLISEREYTIILPPVAQEASIGGQAFQEYTIEVILSGESTTTFDLQMQVLSSENNSQIIQYIVSYVDAFQAYGIRYGDLRILGTGVYDEDWRLIPVSALADRRFNEYYQTFTSTQLPITIFRSTESDLSSTFEVSSFSVEISIDADVTMSTIEIPVSHLIESFSTMGDTTIESVTNKYQQIQGTVSSSVGSQYKDLLLSDFASVTVGSVGSSTFETSLPLITGNGTQFLTDYSVSDVFVANNEYFTVTNLFSDTSLVIDRPPALTFTDVVAYKIV